MSGISNFTIKKIINEIDGDLKQNFVGVFPSNETFRFFKFKHLIREKKAPYPFMIMNTDRSNEEGEYWWSLMEISSKDQIFLFDSFGFVGLKEFIVDNDRQVIDKFFYRLEKINKKDKVINLTFVRFDNDSYKKVNNASLTPTAKDIFHSLSEISKVHNQKISGCFYGRRSASKYKIRHMWLVSAIFLYEFISSKTKQQNSQQQNIKFKNNK